MGGAVNHFRLIATMDPRPLAEAIQANAPRFLDVTARQEHPLSPHPDTETMFCRAPAVIDAHTTFNSLHEEVSYPAWELAPVQVLAYALSVGLGRPLARVMAIKLKPGGIIKAHTDTGAYSEATDRFHFVVQSNPFSFLRAGSEKRCMLPGELWWFDKDVNHMGANYGETDRIHLVMDLYRHGF